jgi:ABC-2 type transport system ATP-binding protein
MQDIEALAERVIVIGHGRVLADGSFDMLREAVRETHLDSPSIEEVISRFYELHGAAEA